MELDDFFRGCGYLPYYVEGEEPSFMHTRMIEVMDEVIEKIKDIKYIKVDDALWRFSKKVTITLESDKRVIYIKNKLFTRVEKTLISTIANSN